MPVKLLLSWWNLIYIVPFGLALVYLLIYVMTGIGGDHDAGDVGAHVDLDADADADLDADADADADLDADADGDGDGEGEHVDSDMPVHVAASVDHGGGGGGPLATALSFIGVGKAPISVLIVMLLISWSIIGFALNQIIYQLWPTEWLPPLLSLPAAFFGSLFATAGLARVLGRWMPSTETSARRKDQLVGRKGKAIYAIDEKFGLVAVRNAEGDLFQVPGRTRAGVAGIAAGAEVVLFDYLPEEDVFLVALLDEKKRIATPARRAETMPRDPPAADVRTSEPPGAAQVKQ